MTANLKANPHATGKHKDVPAFQRLQPLLGDFPAPCLSLYQTTFRQFPDSQQNLVRYRNLLRQLKDALEQKHRNVSDRRGHPVQRPRAHAGGVARAGVAAHGAALSRAAPAAARHVPRCARGLATDDLTHALEFATDGRVGMLLVEAGRRIPGHVEGRMPRRTDRDEPAAGDILDDLAERVLKTGGQAIVAPRGSMPTSTGLAAVFRY